MKNKGQFSHNFRITHEIQGKTASNINKHQKRSTSRSKTETCELLQTDDSYEEQKKLIDAIRMFNSQTVNIMKQTEFKEDQPLEKLKVPDVKESKQMRYSNPDSASYLQQHTDRSCASSSDRNRNMKSSRIHCKSFSQIQQPVKALPNTKGITDQLVKQNLMIFNRKKLNRSCNNNINTGSINNKLPQQSVSQIYMANQLLKMNQQKLHPQVLYNYSQQCNQNAGNFSSTISSYPSTRSLYVPPQSQQAQLSLNHNELTHFHTHSQSHNNVLLDQNSASNRQTNNPLRASTSNKQLRQTSDAATSTPFDQFTPLPSPKATMNKTNNTNTNNTIFTSLSASFSQQPLDSAIFLSKTLLGGKNPAESFKESQQFNLKQIKETYESNTFQGQADLPLLKVIQNVPENLTQRYVRRQRTTSKLPNDKVDLNRHLTYPEKQTFQFCQSKQNENIFNNSNKDLKNMYEHLNFKSIPDATITLRKSSSSPSPMKQRSSINPNRFEHRPFTAFTQERPARKISTTLEKSKQTNNNNNTTTTAQHDSYTSSSSSVMQDQFLAKVIATQRSAVFEKLKGNQMIFDKIKSNLTAGFSIIPVVQEITGGQQSNTGLSSKNQEQQQQIPENKVIFKVENQEEIQENHEETDDHKLQNINKKESGGVQLISPWLIEKNNDEFSADDSLDFIQYANVS